MLLILLKISYLPLRILLCRSQSLRILLYQILPLLTDDCQLPLALPTVPLLHCFVSFLPPFQSFCKAFCSHLHTFSHGLHYRQILASISSFITLPAATPQLPPTPVPLCAIVSDCTTDLANDDQTSLRAFIAPSPSRFITWLAPSCVEIGLSKLHVS